MEKVALSTYDDRRVIATSIPFSRLVSYAIAACLMVVGIFGVRQMVDLKSQLLAARADAAGLRESNALTKLRLTTLDARDVSYASSKIAVAWDPYQHRGAVAAENLPAAPTGQDYQLWVLDPEAPTPINAGIITTSRTFMVTPISTQNPGFAISLEPSGGSPVPTGPILFAVAPGS